MRFHPQRSQSDEAVPRCAVVICTRDRPTQLAACVESVSLQAYPNLTVLVVENGAPGGSAKRIAAQWGAEYIWEPKPGLSRARNRGARPCGADIIAFLDDDCIAEQNWVSELVRVFDDPNVMAATGRILPLPGEPEDDRVLNDLDMGEQPQMLNKSAPMWFERANFGGIGTGGNMAFRQDAFETWAGFDVRLGRGAVINGGEEQYAFFKLIDAGYSVAYAPTAVVRHPQHYQTSVAKLRYLAECSTATAYLTFLFLNEPRYRGALLHYGGQALMGEKRQWRRDVNAPRTVSRAREFLARVAGPCICTKLLFRRTRGFA